MITAISSMQASTPQLRVKTIQKQSFKGIDKNNEIQKQQNKSNVSFGSSFKKTLGTGTAMTAIIDTVCALGNVPLSKIGLISVILLGATAVAAIFSKE